MEEDDDGERVGLWVDRLGEFISSLDEIDGDDPFDFCENAWQSTAFADPPQPTSPAMLVILETLRALARVMTAAMLDHYTTPDVRDRMTRDAAQGSLKEAFDGIRRDGERWLREGAPAIDRPSPSSALCQLGSTS